MAKKPSPPAETVSFEATIDRVEAIVNRMESGEQPLEQAVSDFEEGMRLTQQAQALLRKAEQKVQLLLEGGDGEPVATPLDDNSKQD